MSQLVCVFLFSFIFIYFYFFLGGDIDCTEVREITQMQFYLCFIRVARKTDKYMFYRLTGQNGKALFVVNIRWLYKVSILQDVTVTLHLMRQAKKRRVSLKCLYLCPNGPPIRVFLRHLCFARFLGYQFRDTLRTTFYTLTGQKLYTLFFKIFRVPFWAF